MLVLRLFLLPVLSVQTPNVPNLSILTMPLTLLLFSLFLLLVVFFSTPLHVTKKTALHLFLSTTFFSLNLFQILLLSLFSLTALTGTTVAQDMAS